MTDEKGSKTDVFIYLGDINRKGYDELSTAIEKRINGDILSEKVIFCISTYGGDPNAGYRIGRALQHYYPGNVTVLVPSLCKSAGTLAVMAANHLVIGDRGELGPLDIQLRKSDEMGEHSSGLDIFKAIDQLQERTINAFREYLTDIKYGSGISTRLSADIASQIVNSLIQPISSQIDPMKIGEHQRAMGIALSYGERLRLRSNNLKDDALNKLIIGYPSHGFVIDRSEARELFENVDSPTGIALHVYKMVSAMILNNPRSIGGSPLVLDFDNILKGETNEPDANARTPENDDTQEAESGTEQNQPDGAGSGEANKQEQQINESGTKPTRKSKSKSEVN
ncbi:SppA protein [Budviciaceae bacterium CWB-B4]|uniref:SppA protein n=1 Tax=Limnobaculum xujianqingii TaxID=2738837 RepID=A0A9D7AGE2_9GAMM|nr:SppA protein [Limnobaculum xujianqingii]MBK5072243.1 SppA protein [Limnobaculum xujianqingii]MBK5175552.1 SppA protein [Limnobaculum xujianqingii]